MTKQDRKYTTVSVSHDTYKELSSRASWGESLNAVIRKLLKLNPQKADHDHPTKKSIINNNTSRED